MPDDDDLIKVAADYVQQRGPDAVPWIREKAELAEGLGQHETARIWWEIASAAASILLETAKRCRRLATSMTQRETCERLLQLARECERRAAEWRQGAVK